MKERMLQVIKETVNYPQNAHRLVTNIVDYAAGIDIENADGHEQIKAIGLVVALLYKEDLLNAPGMAGHLYARLLETTSLLGA